MHVRPGCQILNAKLNFHNSSIQSIHKEQGTTPITCTDTLSSTLLTRTLENTRLPPNHAPKRTSTELKSHRSTSEHYMIDHPQAEETYTDKERSIVAND